MESQALCVMQWMDKERRREMNPLDLSCLNELAVMHLLFHISYSAKVTVILWQKKHGSVEKHWISNWKDFISSGPTSDLNVQCPLLRYSRIKSQER